MMSFTSPENYELSLITKDITEKTKYYAKGDRNVIKIYKTAPVNASVAAAASLYDLVTDAITGYEMGTDQTPEDAVPFYVITEYIGEEYNISDNPPMYVLPSLSIDKFDSKVEAERLRIEKEQADEADEAERLRIEKEQKAEEERLRLAKIESDSLAAELEKEQKAEEERLRLAKIESDRLAAELEKEQKAEEERLRLAKIESDHLAAVEAERLRLEKEQAERLQLEKIESDRLAATTSKPQRRGFPNFGSSCWALSIIHLFYDTPDFREYILNYNIQKNHEIFNMKIPHYIGVKSGEMSTQYHIDKLKNDNNDMFTKMNPLFNTTDGTYKDIPNIQHVWGFQTFRNEVLKIISNKSITDKKSAIETLYASLFLESNTEESRFKAEIQKFKTQNTERSQMNEIFIYAFKYLFKYTRGEDIEPDTLIKSLFVIPLIVFGEFGQQDNTEFITKLAQLCEISINLSTYNLKTKIEQTFYVKDPTNPNKYLGDLIGIKKYFSITEKDTKYYYDGKNCTTEILSSKESFIYGLPLGVASNYNDDDSVETYLNKSNPSPMGSFFLPDKNDFLKNNSSLTEKEYNAIQEKYNSQIQTINDKKWEILKAKFNIPENINALTVETEDGKNKINTNMMSRDKFSNWLKTQNIKVVVPDINVGSNINFKTSNTSDTFNGVVKKIEGDNYSIERSYDGTTVESIVNRNLLQLPSETTVWNEANTEYRTYENGLTSNQCQKSNAQNFVTDKYLCVQLMRKTINPETGVMGELIETTIILNDIIMVDSNHYKLIGATIYEGGHYYYNSIRDGLKLNDETVNGIDNNENKYIAKHWSIALYERDVDLNAYKSAASGGSRKTFRVSRRKQVRPL